MRQVPHMKTAGVSPVSSLYLLSRRQWVISHCRLRFLCDRRWRFIDATLALAMVLRLSQALDEASKPPKEYLSASKPSFSFCFIISKQAQARHKNDNKAPPNQPACTLYPAWRLCSMICRQDIDDVTGPVIHHVAGANGVFAASDPAGDHRFRR